MKKVVITGVTGFLGGSLARTLLSLGIEVIGVDVDSVRLAGFADSPLFKPVVADFERYDELPELIGEAGVDVFYHFAWAGGFTSAIRDYKLQMYNAGCAGDALVAAHGIGARRFVYANTYNQYEIVNFLQTESFEPRYTCIYATAKTAAGLLCRTLAYNLGIEYAAALIPMPYGENNYSRQLFNVVVDCLNNGRAPKLVEGDNLYDLVYVQDIADALIAIGDRGRNDRDYYVGHRTLKTFKEWMVEIRDAIAPDVELRFGEYEDRQQIDYGKVDLEALYRDTGWECQYELGDRIAEVAAWVRENVSD